MLGWAAIFLIMAVVTGVLGFGGIAGTASWIAQMLFLIFVALFVVSLVLQRREPPYDDPSLDKPLGSSD